ncbi:DUF6345 domain-containing protein [Paracoccus mangrovi]|uniref:DUF6345 domain-containing protein n=1 Tax=Paracoccus mangrovi TaxID=1715645 RepID=A0ABV7R803_9RHOB
MEDLVGSFDAFTGTSQRLLFRDETLGDPGALPECPEGDVPRTQIYGACSIESYRAAGALHAAHRDAGGFLDQVDCYVMPDFWRRDGAVKSWIYATDAREVSSGRNMDAVRVFYHAGHGRVDENGVFHLPMGALWSGADACLSSEQMTLGRQNLRYLFWSTSESLCLSERMDPMHVWARANAGLRMMFGFGSVCWDSGKYGANFWRHWRMGKSLSQSWLDGAWDVAPDQIPVVSACGANRHEAIDTLFGERRFSEQRARGDWWAWRWHAPLAAHQRGTAPFEAPAELQAARLVPVAADMDLAERVLAALDVDPALCLRDGEGRIAVRLGDTRFLRRVDGHILLELQAGGPGRGGRASLRLQRRSIVNRARNALRRFGFVSPGSELIFDRMTLAMSASSNLYMLGEPALETVDEIIVQFRQAIGGVPVLTSGAGTLKVVLCPDGDLLRIESTLRQVAELMPARGDRNGHPADPLPPAGTEPVAAAATDADQMLALHSARLMRDLAARGAAPLNLRVLPDTSEIGYGIRSNTARLVARKGIEIECVRGFRKRYWMQSDLGD